MASEPCPSEGRASCSTLGAAAARASALVTRRECPERPRLAYASALGPHSRRVDSPWTITQRNHIRHQVTAAQTTARDSRGIVRRPLRQTYENAMTITAGTMTDRMSFA